MAEIESVAGSGGTDIVPVSINLSDTVHYKGAPENVLLTGSAGLSAIGNAAANVLDGSANTAGNLLGALRLGQLRVGSSAERTDQRS